MIKEIQNTVKEEFEQVQKRYHDCLFCEIPLLNDVSEYILQRNGKMLRPTLLLLSAATNPGHLTTEQKIQLATAVEILHNSTLLHDDVVDDDNYRRGRESVKHRFSNQIAVLVGDFYLAQCMSLIHDSDDKHAVSIISNVVAEMSKGELLQQQVLRGEENNDQIYLEIVYRKTASLMAACCQIGNDQLAEFGKHYGMAFQLRDDINDTESRPNTMKYLQEEKEKAYKSLEILNDSIYKQALTKLIDIL